MVDRFQQQKLASAQTPVSEVDHSMSQGAALIAQAADRQRDMIMSTAAQHIANAQGSYSRANGFAQQAAGSVVNMLSAGMRANKGAGDEERRRLNVAMARISENDLAEQTFNDYRQRYAENPGAALAAFHADVPNMRQAFQDRYGDDEKSLRELLPVHDGFERQTKARLESWATRAQTTQLESRLNLLPEEMSVQIDGFQGTVDEQLDSFKSLLMSSNDTFKFMYQSAQDEGTRNNITLQEIKAKRKLSQDFVNHLVAQTPQGEAGIGYIDQIGHMVRNAHQIRLPLSADHQKEAIGYLHGVRAEEEQDVILGVQNESSIRLVGLNLYKASILDASASGDKAAIRTISTKVKKHVDALGRRIDQLSQQPDSNIKKAKILALKQEQTTLITEIGMGLNQERSLDNIFRAVESFARATRGEQRALAAMARSNIMFTNYLADREIRQQEKEARQASAQAFDKQLDRFNKGWQGITNKIQSAYALSAGEAQTKRITEIANEAVPMLNKAVRAGTITRDSYKAYIERIGKQLENASELRTIKVKEKFFGMEIPWGEEQLQVRKLKGAERDKAVQKAQAQFGKVVESYKKEFDDMGTAYSYLNAWALGKHEKAVLTQYLDEKLPLVLGSKKFKSLPDSVQQDKVLAGLIRKSIESYRRGTLK